VVALEEEAVANKARMVKLEEWATEWEVQLGKVEAELTAQTEALERAKANLPHRLKPSGGPRRSSSTMPPKPMQRGSSMLFLRLLASILRWTSPPSRRRTILWMGRSCLSALKRSLCNLAEIVPF